MAKTKKLFFITLLLSIFVNFPGYACKFKQDPRPFEERLKEAPIAFIGTVARVDKDEIEFSIEHWLHGDRQDKKFIEKNTGISKCDIRFQTGEHWIYGGSKIYSPSILLSANSELKRFDDSKIKTFPQWQACETDSDCEYFSYGCSHTAINKNFRKLAQDELWKGGYDPRTRNCVINPVTFSHPLCEQKKCGIWELK